MNRYVVTFERYLWADTDEAAIEQAKEFADKIANVDDNHCTVTNIVEQPFGTTSNRQVYGRLKEVTQ